jgi:uncharacterized repeat protein (TIGR01451 family)
MRIARLFAKATLALASLGAVSVLQGAYAAGTDAGVAITNRATVSYSVASVAQTPIESSPTGNSTPGANQGSDTSFIVDRRIFMSVADIAGAPASVPGATGVVRAFTVTNTSNATIGFSLAVSEPAAGDQFDLLNRLVRVDSASQPSGSYTPGTYEAGVDVATGIVSLPEDFSITVYVIGDIPAAVVNGDTSIVDLQITAIEPSAPDNVGAVGSVITATAGADTAGVDTVLGDSGNDGIENATNVYTISSAALSVTKAAIIVSDPFNGTGAGRKAIPGAVIEYAIQIQNSGSSSADTVTVSDAIPAGATYLAGSLTRDGSALTDAADADGGQANGTPVTDIAVTVPAITAGGSATITFRVTID